MLRRVLFVAYNFPPHGGAGVQRSLKFVKYLPDFGWQPLVVTTSADASPLQDPSLLADLPPDLSIWRVSGFSISKLQSQLAGWGLGKLAVGLNILLQIPDAARFWAHSIRPLLAQIAEAESPDVIYTTSGPYSSHLAGMWVRCHLRIPWFADFRDPWSRNLLMPYLPGYRRWNRRMERMVLAAADRVACVSEPWLDDLRANLGESPEKFLVLPNGYDEVDIQPTPLPTSNDRFTLVHLGSFYRNRRPDGLIEAVDKLVDSGRISPDEMRIMFVGKNACDSVPERPPFETHDYVPHKELDLIRAQANAFLLILSTSADNIGNHSGKLFEYLASSRPILGIVPPGGVAQQLIEETRTGITAGGDVPAIANAIETLFRRWKEGMDDWNPDWGKIRQYGRRNLTSRLAAELDDLAKTKTRS